MHNTDIFLANEDATVALGNTLAKFLLAQKEILKRNFCIYLQGDLGAGKTTLTRGFLRACGHKGNVKSPTYTLVENYKFDDFTVYHFDLYRLNDPMELEYIGIRDYFSPATFCLIEWPEKAHGLIPKANLQINLSYNSEVRQCKLLSDCLVQKDLDFIKQQLQKTQSE